MRAVATLATAAPAEAKARRVRQQLEPYHAAALMEYEADLARLYDDGDAIYLGSCRSKRGRSWRHTASPQRDRLIANAGGGRSHADAS